MVTQYTTTRMERRRMQQRMQRMRVTRAVAGSAMASALLIQAYPAKAAQRAYTTANVRIRSEQSVESKQLACLDEGDRVTVLGVDGSWTRVRMGSVEGYVYSKYLADAKGNPIKGITLGATSPSEASEERLALQDVDKQDLYDYAPKMVGRKIMRGMENKYVVWLQGVLTIADCYLGPTEGKFDGMTEDAVKRFQAAYGLKDDGVVGKRTMNKLFAVLGYDANAGADDADDEEEAQVLSASQSAAQAEAHEDAQRASVPQPEVERAPIVEEPSADVPAPVSTSGVQLLDWFVSGNASFTKNVPARVYDVWTGNSYYVTRFGGSNHADVVPLTAEDAQVLFATFDYNWKWDPRPVYVTVSGVTFVGSINGMPHGTNPIPENGMDGQICIHLLNSKTHNGNASFERQHQSALLKGWEAAQHR